MHLIDRYSCGKGAVPPCNQIVLNLVERYCFRYNRNMTQNILWFDASYHRSFRIIYHLLTE